MGARGRFTDDPVTGPDWSPPCKRSAGKRSGSLRGWGRSDVGAEVGGTGAGGGGSGGGGKWAGGGCGDAQGSGAPPWFQSPHEEAGPEGAVGCPERSDGNVTRSPACRGCEGPPGSCSPTRGALACCGEGGLCRCYG